MTTPPFVRIFALTSTRTADLTPHFRCLDLLRRDMKPVVHVFREFFPSISPRAVSPP